MPARARSSASVASPRTKYTPAPAGFFSDGEDDDLRLVVVALELVDEVAGGAVPAAHDDVVLVAPSTQALTLLEQEIDDERDEGTGDQRQHGDPEQDKQPADRAPAGDVT